MEESPIKVRPENLSGALAEFEKGVLRIPRFQRDYVWERTRVAKLFDSIYKGFPIGSFFYWITPQEYKDHYRDISELKLSKPESYEQIKMILDGQQRLTSLYVAAKGLTLKSDSGTNKDYKKICFDLDTEEFESSKQKEDKERKISVWRFFDINDNEGVYDALTPERKKIFNKCRRILTNYPISIVEVKNMELEDAIEIFERINQGGKRLKLFDLVVANTWSEKFDLKEKTNELNSKISDSGFGEIDEEIVVQTLALITKVGCTKAYQLQLTTEEIESKWDEVQTGILLAIDYLKNNFGVKIYSFIPYQSMVPLLAYVFIKISGRSLNNTQAQFINKWFWVSSFSQRYGSSALTTMSSDVAKYFKPLVEGQNIAFEVKANVEKSDITKLTTGVNSAAKNAVFCIMALNQPKHFKTGAPITLDFQLCSAYNKKENHHIFPYAFLGDHKIKSEARSLLMNFAFITGELNREISKKAPSKYFQDYAKENNGFAKILDSHFIPSSSEGAIWNDDYEKFISDRADIILGKIKNLIGEENILEGNMKSAPMEVIEELENKLRIYIDEKLSLDSSGDYWQKIPSDISERINKKIKDTERRHPYEAGTVLTNLNKLTYNDIMDNSSIILKNWEIFEKDFASKGEVEKHFLNLKEYRNTIMHGRKLNSVARKQGEASLEWLAQVIDYVAD